MRKDLIIGAVANYTKDKIVEYVQSINKSGFTGDKIMICYDLPNETMEYLNQNNWMCYEAQTNGHPHMKRLIDMWQILETHITGYRFVITTDVRDVIFQTNPSDYLEEKYYYGDRLSGWWEKTEVFVASERLQYHKQEWNIKNIHEGYGNIYWEWIKNKEIGNVGIIAGKGTGVKALLMLNWLVSQAGDVRHYTDQSSLNLLIHNDLIKDKVTLVNDLCLQVGTLNEELDIRDGIVYNPITNKPYPLIHQWDRNETLTKLFKTKWKQQHN